MTTRKAIALIKRILPERGSLMRRSIVVPAGLALVALVVTVPVAMSADGDDPVSARTYMVRTVEDPSLPPVPDSDCPSGAGILIKPRGFAWSLATRASDGMVATEQIQRVGSVSTCARLPLPIIEGDTTPTFARIELGGDTYTASGRCRATSNGVPQERVVLAGCALRLQTGPPGFVDSARVFEHVSVGTNERSARPPSASRALAPSLHIGRGLWTFPMERTDGGGAGISRHVVPPFG
jgi:hypothetical protein